MLADFQICISVPLNCASKENHCYQIQNKDIFCEFDEFSIVAIFFIYSSLNIFISSMQYIK